jgi:hypothetical protein
MQSYDPYYYWQFFGPPYAYPGNAYNCLYYGTSPICDYGILAARIFPYVFSGYTF